MAKKQKAKVYVIKQGRWFVQTGVFWKHCRICGHLAEAEIFKTKTEADRYKDERYGQHVVEVEMREV